MNNRYEAMTDTQKIGRHALVIGGSLAGLFAARVLVDFFDKVTILDRDVFPVTPDHRKGVPQSYHADALLPTAFPILERLFPIRQAGHFVQHDAANLVTRNILNWLARSTEGSRGTLA
jgi:2-polyprenyl-6-methoxyphenol hydroxylase-like FAD-dependent oxidoreductase